MSDFHPMTDSALSNELQWNLVANTNNIATEDHLQSLGLTEQDGLPQFNLNDVDYADLTSSITQQNDKDNDNDSESSFVVLSKTSLESIRDDAMATYTEILQKSQLTVSLS